MSLNQNDHSYCEFIPSRFQLPVMINEIPEVLKECWGQIGDRERFKLGSRFGGWKRTAFPDVWWIHDKNKTGFTYRVMDHDLAYYNPVTFDIFLLQK